MNESTRKLMFSSKKLDWATPQDFFNKLDNEFHFTLDPCCTKQTAKCKKFFTPKENGLLQDWGGETVFVNPPYGRVIKLWVRKCYEESLKPNTKVVLLIPARTDTSYFHDYLYGKAELRFIRGRLKFHNTDSILEESKWTGAPFPSMLAILGGNK